MFLVYTSRKSQTQTKPVTALRVAAVSPTELGSVFVKAAVKSTHFCHLQMLEAFVSSLGEIISFFDCMSSLYMESKHKITPALLHSLNRYFFSICLNSLYRDFQFTSNSPQELFGEVMSENQCDDFEEVISNGISNPHSNFEFNSTAPSPPMTKYT